MGPPMLAEAGIADRGSAPLQDTPQCRSGDNGWWKGKLAPPLLSLSRRQTCDIDADLALGLATRALLDHYLVVKAHATVSWSVRSDRSIHASTTPADGGGASLSRMPSFSATS